MNRFLHSRTSVIIAALMAAICAFVFFCIGDFTYPQGNVGLVKNFDSQWIGPRNLNLFIGLGANIGIAFLIISLTRRYNLLRNLTMLPATLFLIMQMATPISMTYLSSGLILCVGIILCLFLMYESYGNPDCTRYVFLSFFILSLGSSIDYGFGVFIPVFFLALAQMRIFSIRSLLASLMGISTPWIIFFGFGILTPDDLQMPVFQSFSLNISTLQRFSFIGTAIITSFLALAAWLQNIMRILSYNAHSRAMLSILTVVMYVTLLASAIDFVHIPTFLPLINLCAAMQFGHLFGVIYTSKKTYIAILSIIALYIIIYIWRIIVCTL